MIPRSGWNLTFCISRKFSAVQPLHLSIARIKKKKTKKNKQANLAEPQNCLGSF